MQNAEQGSLSLAGLEMLRLVGGDIGIWVLMAGLPVMRDIRRGVQRLRGENMELRR